MLSYLWDCAYERVAHVAAAGFLSHYLSGPLPYVRCHITVNKKPSFLLTTKLYLVPLIEENKVVNYSTRVLANYTSCRALAEF